MKIALFATATAAIALLGSAASAQQTNMPKPPTPGSVTGDWNGAHAPSDDKQYTDTVRVPLGASPASSRVGQPADVAADASATSEAVTPAPSATDNAQSVSVTTSTVTNGPVPDTAENRAKYGDPMSRAGKRTAAKGN